MVPKSVSRIRKFANKLNTELRGTTVLGGLSFAEKQLSGLRILRVHNFSFKAFDAIVGILFIPQ